MHATRVACFVVCVSVWECVCLCVGHTGEPCINGRTDLGTVWSGRALGTMY